MQKTPRLSSIVNLLLQKPGRVLSATLAVGDLIAPADEEIHSEWSQLVRGTNLSGTKLNIQHVAAEQQCMVCFQKYKPLISEISCPHCGSVGAKIVSGEEFFLISSERENE